MKRLQYTLLLAVFLGLVSGICVNSPPGYLLDDWANRARVLAYPDVQELLTSSLTDRTRPLSVVMVYLAMYAFWDHPAVFALLSVAGFAFSCGCIIYIIYTLSGRWRDAVLAAGLWVSFPTLSSNQHWPTMIVSAGFVALPCYLLSAASWLYYLKNKRTSGLVLSVISYAAGLFSYEIGFFLPAVFLLTALVNRQIRSLWWGTALFSCTALLYALWRITDAFGMADSAVLPTHMTTSFSLWNLRFNLFHIVSMWAGPELFWSYTVGLQSALASPGAMLAAVLVSVSLLTFIALSDRAVPNSDPLLNRQSTFVIGIVWLVVAYMPGLLTYVTSRISSLPAVGLVLAVSPVFAGNQGITRYARLLACGLIILGLVANAGSALQWRACSTFHTKCHQYLHATKNMWTEADYVVFNTSGLPVKRSSFHRRLFPLMQEHAQYGNAQFLRGFALSTMVRLHTAHPPQVILDTEQHPRMEGDHMVWHERYNPEKTFQVSTSAVFFIDASQFWPGE